MQITLSTAPASESWGKNAILSFNQDQAVIHLKDDEKSNLVLVQKAARKLRGQGIKDVELVGDAWELENCWAFYQGFYSAKQDYSIEFPHLDDEPQDELLARIECGDFVRGIINEPAETLTPVKLAERAAEFISKQAENYADKSAVSFQIISGARLPRDLYCGSWFY